MTEAPNKLRRLVLVLIPAAAFIGLLAYGLIQSAPSKVTPGTKVPAFELPSLLGDGTVTSEELRGSPVVVNFWASWCVPCRQEAALFERVYRDYSDEGVIFLGVNIKDSDVGAIEFVDEYQISYPTVRDVDEDFARTLGVTGVPETFFIDARGRFVSTASGSVQGEQRGSVVLGPITEEDLVENIEILLRRG